jgi:glycogen debranching enzyme
MQRIHIRAFPPYRTWLDGQSEVVLEVDGPIAIREMWARLARAYPRFGELLAYETDEELSRALVVLQEAGYWGLPIWSSPVCESSCCPPLPGDNA